jgi:hypothetical protein
MTLLIIIVRLLSNVCIRNLLRRLVIEHPLVGLQLHILLRVRSLISQPLFLRLIMVLIVLSLIHTILSIHHPHWIHFLIVHRIVFLLQILNSRFMILRFHNFLDASRKRSLDLSFLFWIRSNLLSTHFGGQTLCGCVFGNVTLRDLICIISIFRCLVTLRRIRFSNTFH